MDDGLVVRTQDGDEAAFAAIAIEVSHASTPSRSASCGTWASLKTPSSSTPSRTADQHPRPDPARGGSRCSSRG